MPPEDQNKKRIIRNASLEEIEKLRMQESVPGKTESAVKSEAPKKEEKSDSIFKDKKSPFEPEPVPMRLPSGNIFVKNNLTPKNEIYVRRMGAVEENMFYKLLGATEMKIVNATIDAVMDNCIRSKIDVYDLALIDKLPIFFKIIKLTYGVIEIKQLCKSCGVEHIFKFDPVSDLKITYVPSDLEYPKNIKVTSFPNAKINWFVLYPTIRQTSKFFDADMVDVMRMLTDRFEGTIVENGKEREITSEDYENILVNLNDDDRQTYRDFLNEFGSYGVQLALSKPFCKTKECELYEKPQEFDIPIEMIFARIIQLQSR